MSVSRSIEDVLRNFRRKDVTGRIAHRKWCITARDHEVLRTGLFFALQPKSSDIQIRPCVEDLLGGAIGREDKTSRPTRVLLRTAEVG